MRCTNPRTYGFMADGRSLTRSKRKFSKEYDTVQLPCGKCISCQLNYAREWAIRAIHEAQMYEKNSFITLTYSDEHLVSEKLQYEDFQKFMRRLRKTQNDPIGIFVTGEYGSKTNRPHWHAIIFNWRPNDLKEHYKNGRGDQVYTSESLTDLWGKGHAELGSVTIDSAGYVARYAAKAWDQSDEHYREYKPISKKSQKYAIGKKWLEKYWEDIFNYGELRVDGKKVPIPRYYIKWLKKNQPERWKCYVTETRRKAIAFATEKSLQENASRMAINDQRRATNGLEYTPVTTSERSRKKILEQKFKILNERKKL